MSKEEKKVYEACIRLGDSHEQAIQAVEIEKKKQEVKEEYYRAYNI